jgi:hypothetical protein
LTWGQQLSLGCLLMPLSMVDEMESKSVLTLAGRGTGQHRPLRYLRVAPDAETAETNLVT